MVTTPKLSTKRMVTTPKLSTRYTQEFVTKSRSDKITSPFIPNINLNNPSQYRRWRTQCLDQYIFQVLPNVDGVKQACCNNPDSIFGLFQALRKIPDLNNVDAKEKLQELEATARACRQAKGKNKNFDYLKQKYLGEKIFEKQSTLNEQCQSCIEKVYNNITPNDVSSHGLLQDLQAICIASAKRQITSVSKSTSAPAPAAPAPALSITTSSVFI